MRKYIRLTIPIIFFIIIYKLFKRGNISKDISINNSEHSKNINFKYNTEFKLKTLTYNIFSRWKNIVGDEGQFIRLKNIPKNIYNNIDLGNDIDIITINELWCPDPTCGKLVCGNDKSGDIFINEMNKYGWKYNTGVLCSLDNPLIYKQIGGGCIIFSKWKIEKTKKYVFKNCYGIDCRSSKGAIYTRVLKEINTQEGINIIPINIIVTHLQSNEGTEQDNIRKLQLKELYNSFIIPLNIPKNEILLYQGDFNIDKKDSFIIENILNSKIPNIIGNQLYSFDSKTNKLVGRDGIAKEYGCEEYYNKYLNCPCCPRLLFDYILYSKEHKQPKKSDIKIIPLKNDTNLKYYLDISKGLTSFIKSTKIKVNNNELSDHYPVVANFIF
jgi:hypothetical protein